MPTVTLLKPASADYTVIRGGSSTSFKGGEPMDVSIPVALQLKNLRSGDKPMFKVEDIPDLVLSDTAEKNKKEKAKKVVQDKLF